MASDHARQKVCDAIERVTLDVLAAGRASIGPNECVRWAFVLLQELTCRRSMPRAIFQSGTAMFPMLSQGTPDDGGETHFSYVWELSEQTRRRVERGVMPEMHAWVAVPDHGIIVDATLGFQRENYTRTQAIANADASRWTNAELPAVFVGDSEDAGRLRLSYRADMAAIECVHVLREPTLARRWIRHYFD